MNNISNSIIVRVIDQYTVVINKGSDDGIKLGQKFLIYSIDDEDIIDPITRANLGKLEIVKGRGAITHVQEKISTIESILYMKPIKKIIKTNSNIMFGTPSSQEEVIDSSELEPFDTVHIGDFAKLI